MVKRVATLKDTNKQKRHKKKAQHTGGKRVKEDFGNPLVCRSYRVYSAQFNFFKSYCNLLLFIEIGFHFFEEIVSKIVPKFTLDCR